MNLEIIRRSLRHGMPYGLCVGLGACCIDALYLFLFSMGMGVASASPSVSRVLYFAGGVLLTYLAVLTFRDLRSVAAKAGRAEDEAAPEAAPSLLRSYLVGLGMTAANPMTIIFWSALSLEFAPYSIGTRLAATGATLLGCLSWVLLISGVLGVSRHRVSPRAFAAVTFVGGACVLYYGLKFLAAAAGLVAP